MLVISNKIIIIHYYGNYNLFLGVCPYDVDSIAGMLFIVEDIKIFAKVK